MSQQSVGTSPTSLDYASAKAQYKQARKAAGKSRKPLAIGIIIAIVLVAGISCFLTWSFVGGVRSSLIDNGDARNEVATHESNQENLGTAVERAEEKNESYVGIWKGACKETTTIASGNKDRKCYGGETSDMTLDIKKVSATGRVEADITVVYHGHEIKHDSPTAATSTSGDVVETFTNVTGTFSNGRFSFVGEVDGTENAVEIEIAPESTSSSVLVASVTSTYENRKYVKDTYDLAKASD